MKKNTLLIVLLVILSLFVVCGFLFWDLVYLRILPIKVSKVAQSFPYSFDNDAFSPQIIDDLEEVFTFAATRSGKPALALAQRESGEILAVDADGILYEWCWGANGTWELCQETDLQSAAPGLVHFSDDASLLILPKAIEGEVIQGYRVWDTSKTIVVRESPEYEEYVITGIYLNPSGDIIVDYAYGSELYIFNWQEKKSLPVDLYSYVREYYPVIGRVAIDHEGKFMAIAYQDGQVAIGEVEEGNYLFNNREYSLLEEDSSTEVKDLMFNPSRKKLAWLSEHKLVVINLQRSVFRIGIATEVEDGTLLVFDRTGKILVVAAGDSLLFFDVVRNNQIARYDVGTEITSIAFSQDNRLFLWGDAEGNLHMWGVPKE